MVSVPLSMAMRISGLKIEMIILGCMLMLVLLFINVGSAKTITVDDDGGEDYENIQYAIDNATSGDTIRVFEGRYREHITINASLVLQGNGSTESIIIQEENHYAISINTDNVTIIGFTITHSTIFDISYFKNGILIHGNNTKILNNNISNNWRGIEATYSLSGLVVDNNSFLENLITGVAFYSITNSVFKNNIQSGSAQGIYLWNCTDNMISDNQILKNSFSGVTFEDSHNNTISMNIIEENGVGIRFKTTHYKHLKSSINNEIHNNSITNSSLNGINTSKNQGEIVDVRFNYWGNGSGPYHHTLNPNGTGNTVSSEAIFNPWYDDEENLVYAPELIIEGETDDNFNKLPLFILILIFCALLIALGIIVHRPR